MRALVCHRASQDGSGLVVEPDWREVAAPGIGEVTVAMTAVSLIGADLSLDATGSDTSRLPCIVGTRGVGVIVAVGEDVSGELIGERVLVSAPFGCLAERLTLPVAAVRSVAGGLHDADAAASLHANLPVERNVTLDEIHSVIAAIASGEVTGQVIVTF